MSRRIATKYWLFALLPAVILAYALIDRALFNAYVHTTISWTNPIEISDGDPNDEIAGYDIYCWAEGGRFTKSIHIGDPSITHFVIEDVAPRTYSCAVSAVTIDGRQSALSNVVATTLH
jgi:hypothetical protein